jgi:hypothetical protein
MSADADINDSLPAYVFCNYMAANALRRNAEVRPRPVVA